jgi:CRP-like cAMP-binding protein
MISFLSRKEEPKVLKMLENVPLFSSLDRKELRRMAANFKERTFDTGEVIEKEGDKHGIAFYLIIEGSVEVSRGKKTIAKLASGQYFGEMALVDKQPRSATVVAIEPTTCLLMTSWNFMAFLETDSKLAIGVVKELARRLRETDQALSE